MKVNILIYSIILLVFVSCSSQRAGEYSWGSAKYENKEGYKNLYIVDTISIKDPIRVYDDNGNHFVMSKETFDLYDGTKDFLYTRPDVFFLEVELPFGMPQDAYPEHFISECFKWTLKSNEKKKGLSAFYTFERQPTYFLMFFVRGDYFNSIFTGIDGPDPIKFKKNKYLFYKVVIPICL